MSDKEKEEYIADAKAVAKVFKDAAYVSGRAINAEHCALIRRCILIVLETAIKRDYDDPAMTQVRDNFLKAITG